MNKVILDGNNLTIEEVVKVAREFVPVEIAQESREEIIKVRKYIEENWMTPSAPPIYGFNTGVGKLKDFNISVEENDQFQNNIVMSHCGGVGEPADEEIVRATMVVRLNAFCQGVSGLRIEVIDRLLEMLNKGVHPVIPIQGSVGACGDLAPLAHMVSVLIGYPEAEAYYKGEKMSAPKALEKAGITPVQYQLKAKDCLALINGTTMFAGMAALNYYDAERLLKEVEISGALSLEAMRGEMAAFDERIHRVRKQKGQMDCARNVREITRNSKRTTEEARKVHLKYDVLHPMYQPRVQDLYSLRCMAQVQGACRKAKQIINNLYQIIGIEYLLASRAIFVTQEALGQFELGDGTKVVYDTLRKAIPFVMNDSYMPAQSKPAIEIAKEGTMVEKVEEAVGKLI